MKGLSNILLKINFSKKRVFLPQLFKTNIKYFCSETKLQQFDDINNQKLTKNFQKQNSIIMNENQEILIYYNRISVKLLL